MLISYYTLDILVQDDMRRPLSAHVEANGVGSETSSEGIAHFENITTSSPQVIVVYGQVIKRLQPNIQGSPSLSVTFDLTKPSIMDKYSTFSSSGVGVIRFFTEDSGPGASGVDAVSVSYEVAGVQNTVSVYAISYNSFEAKIPAQPPGTLVKYTITVSDKEGNAAVEYGDYVVLAGGSDTAAANISAPGAPTSSTPILPSEGIVVGIAVLAVLAFAVVYYFNKKKGSEVSPPPVTPPEVPKQ